MNDERENRLTRAREFLYERTDDILAQDDAMPELLADFAESELARPDGYVPFVVACENCGQEFTGESLGGLGVTVTAMVLRVGECVSHNLTLSPKVAIRPLPTSPDARVIAEKCLSALQSDGWFSGDLFDDTERGRQTKSEVAGIIADILSAELHPNPQGHQTKNPSQLTGLTHDSRCKKCNTVLRDRQVRGFIYGIVSVLEPSSRPCAECKKLPTDEDTMKRLTVEPAEASE